MASAKKAALNNLTERTWKEGLAPGIDFTQALKAWLATRFNPRKANRIRAPSRRCSRLRRTPAICRVILSKWCSAVLRELSMARRAVPQMITVSATASARLLLLRMEKMTIMTARVRTQARKTMITL
jgi:hypothetical protein